ncbi:MAG: alpha-amylase family glycosyl hydrolase [Cyanobacteria bacterium P01_D01_bin.156]
MFRSLVTFLLALIAVSIPLVFPPQPSGENTVILHAFDWSYNTVAARAAEIAEAGYGAVLVTPPVKSPITPQCYWYQRYQPQDLRVIQNCDGNKEDFIAMIEALSKVNVRTYADVVVNHMANERDASTTFPGQATLQQYANDANYWAKQRLYGNLEHGLFSSHDFHSPYCIRNYGDRNEVIQGRICGADNDPGLPDLRDTLPDETWVLEQRKQYVQALYELGVRGFRIDAAKHMPNDAIRYFIPEDVAKNSHVFAEIITAGGSNDHAYNVFLEPYLKELPSEFAAYDFPLLNAMKTAFSYGQPLSHIAYPFDTGNALENHRAVTVVTTHDIPYNEPFRSLIFDPVDEDLAYAYIMGRDGGTPMVFDDGTTAPPPFGQIDNGRWQNVWNHDRMIHMIRFHNQMQGTSMEILHADPCTLLWRREQAGIGAINKCGIPKTITVNTQSRFKWFHPYQDILTKTPPIEITSESFTFTLTPRSAQLWTAQ